MDNSQQYCLGEYLYISLRGKNLNQILSDYDLASNFLNNLCLEICFENLSIGSFYYTIYYLAKHSSFKDKIKKDFIKFALEIYKKNEILVSKIEEFIPINFSENYQIEKYMVFGRMCYYGINDLIESDKEKSLEFFKAAYDLAKEKSFNFLMRINYLYIYKSRKYLFKQNQITSKKFNKTKEKLFRFYEETDENNLNSIELYNYYKLYKLNVIGNIQDKILRFLKKGKKEKIIYNFINLVYKEKCKSALEKEYSSSNQNNNNIKNEPLENEDEITLIFKTTEEPNKYELSVPINIQFIQVIQMLYNTYPELESKKIGTYIYKSNKIGLFKLVSENGLEDGSIILLLNKKSKNNISYAQDNDEKNINTSINANHNIENLLSENDENAKNAINDEQQLKDVNNNYDINEILRTGNEQHEEEQLKDINNNFDINEILKTGNEQNDHEKYFNRNNNDKNRISHEENKNDEEENSERKSDSKGAHEAYHGNDDDKDGENASEDHSRNNNRSEEDKKEENSEEEENNKESEENEEEEVN